MTEPAVSEEKLADLEQIYGWLKRDAKDMLHDLLDGVSLWRSTATILFIFAISSVGFGSVFVWGSLTTLNVGNGSISLFLGLLATFLFGIALVTTLTGIRYRDKYRDLRAKYSELYDTASRLK